MTLGRSPDPGIGNELDNRCSNSSCSRKNYIILMLEQKRVGCAFISQLWMQLWLGSQSVNRSVLCCSRYPESLVCMVGKPANTRVTWIELWRRSTPLVNLHQTEVYFPKGARYELVIPCRSLREMWLVVICCTPGRRTDHFSLDLL